MIDCVLGVVECIFHYVVLSSDEKDVEIGLQLLTVELSYVLTHYNYFPASILTDSLNFSECSISGLKAMVFYELKQTGMCPSPG